MEGIFVMKLCLNVVFTFETGKLERDAETASGCDGTKSKTADQGKI